MRVRILATIVLALEATALLALLVWQVYELFSAETVSTSSALALIVMTALASVALGGFSVATARNRSWGRSGGIVAQVLILAVALGAVTGAGVAPLVAAALAAPGIVGGVLLVLAVREAGRETPES